MQKLENMIHQEEQIQYEDVIPAVGGNLNTENSQFRNGAISIQDEQQYLSPKPTTDELTSMGSPLVQDFLLGLYK